MQEKGEEEKGEREDRRQEGAKERGGKVQRERARNRREGTEEDKERDGVDGGNGMKAFVCSRTHADSWNTPVP